MLALALALAATLLAQQAAPGSTVSEPYPIGTRTDFTAPEYSSASFRSMDRIFSTCRVPRSGPVSPLERAAEPFTMRYRHDGVERGVDDLVTRTDTTGLLVVHDGTILHEGYYRGADESSRFLSMSVGKSLVSTLVGLAIGDGRIVGVGDPVTRYLPELDLVVVKTSAWPVAWDAAKESESYAFFDAVRDQVKARRSGDRSGPPDRDRPE